MEDLNIMLSSEYFERVPGRVEVGDMFLVRLHLSTTPILEVCRSIKDSVWVNAEKYNTTRHLFNCTKVVLK
jgi:hypothetical protein